MAAREKGFKLGEWIGYTLGLLTLLGLFASSVAWVSSTNLEVAKVKGIQHESHTLYIWAQLVDPVNFRRAEQINEEQK